MELFSIFVMTTLAVGAFALLVTTSQHGNLYCARNLFMAVWLYYGFSVGIDLLTGAEIPYTPGEANLMDARNLGGVVFVMWNYAVCGVAFLLAYSLTGKHETIAQDRQYDIRLPSSWTLVVIHAIAIYLFVSIFFGVSRMERIAEASRSNAMKFAGLIVPLVLVLDIFVMLNDRGHKGRVAWLLAVLLALATGNRSDVLFTFIVAAFRWRPPVRGWKLVSMVATCGLMIFVFKTAYSVGQRWWLGERVDLAMINENLSFSLSSLDAHASYLIAMFYTSEPSPWWLGQSYLQTPLYLTWPRFLGGVEVSTLAESYIWTYHPQTANRGGAMAFSAIAEAWLNFSHLGAVVLGGFWGVVAKYFDTRPRGILFYLALFSVVRLFRSDFATLYKNWWLVWGFLFLLVVGALLVYTVVTSTRASLTRVAGDG